jgi:hypothetical protein
VDEVVVKSEIDDLRAEVEKLRQFYHEVAHLTLCHDHIEISDDEGYAVVFPKDLGPALEKIDKEWWKNAG